MSSPHVCYELFINNEGSVATISGCNAIFSPEKLTDAAAVLADTLNDLGLKNVKAKYDKALKQIVALKVRPSERISACVGIVSNVFGDPRVTQEVRAKLTEVHGWFVKCPTMRVVGKGLFCMGFHDRDNILDTLSALEVGALGRHWFEPVGHGGAEERVEDFRTLYFTFRRRDNEFLEYLKELARQNPFQFFDMNLRPVALRCLGELNKDFFANFCGLNAEAKAALTNDADAARALVGHEKNTTGSRVVRVGGQSILASTFSLFRTILALEQKGLLRFSEEMEVIARKVHLFDCEATLKGKGTGVQETHALCATRRLCLAFDVSASGHTELDALRTRYMQAAAAAKCAAVTFYVRDAQLLCCAQLAHLIWRAAARAAFTELVITMRFDYDPIFCGTAAPFLSALAARQTQISTDTIPPEAETTSASVENLLPDTLAAYSGALIVPLCRDAAISQRGNQSLNEGAQVFTVTPPQFGSVLKMLSAKKVLLKLAIFAEENVAKLAYGEQNVYRSNTTRSRGFMVPVSALLAQRKKTPACHTKATVFVPRCFSALRKKDMVNAARVFFLSVTVVAVETYSLPTQDVSAVESVIAAIAKLVN
jgi:hypothetical protein